MHLVYFPSSLSYSFCLSSIFIMVLIQWTQNQLKTPVLDRVDRVHMFQNTVLWVSNIIRETIVSPALSTFCNYLVFLVDNLLLSFTELNFVLFTFGSIWKQKLVETNFLTCVPVNDYKMTRNDSLCVYKIHLGQCQCIYQVLVLCEVLIDSKICFLYT